MTEVPVTVLGGYLGAGKTTLLNHLLRNAEERIAVLVNDFGAINVDESLLASRDEDTIALTNGCICCSLVDGFAAALDQVRALAVAPDRLVIEASGVADPASVAAWGHGPGFRLDGVIVLADSEQLPRTLEDEYVGDVAAGQLRAADLVVLNKADLVDNARLNTVRQLIADHSDASVIAASHGIVDQAVLVGSFREPTTDTSAIPAATSAAHTSWSHTFASSPTETELSDFLAALGSETVRVKGVIEAVPGRRGRRIVHRVGVRSSVVEQPEPWTHPSVLVGIDIGLWQDRLNTKAGMDS